jgi:hypothetical protein
MTLTLIKFLLHNQVPVGNSKHLKTVVEFEYIDNMYQTASPTPIDANKRKAPEGGFRDNVVANQGAQQRLGPSASSSGHRDVRLATKTKWKSEFPWLEIRTGPNGRQRLHCLTCEEALRQKLIPQNAFVSGSENLQRSALVEHLGIADHKLADSFLHKKSLPDISSSTANAVKCKDISSFFKSNRQHLGFECMLPTFKSVYFLCKQNLALFKIPSLLKCLEHIGVEVYSHYRDHHAAREIALSIEEIVVQDIDLHLMQSKFIGLQVDSATDASSQEQLTLAVKYVKQDGTLTGVFL